MGHTLAEKGRGLEWASGHGEEKMDSQYIFKVELGRQIRCGERGGEISESGVTAPDSFTCHYLPQKQSHSQPPFFINPECFGESGQKCALLSRRNSLHACVHNILATSILFYLVSRGGEVSKMLFVPSLNWGGVASPCSLPRTLGACLSLSILAS